MSVQALDNVLFDGVQWLTRPHLSPRPLRLSSPHALPCKTKHTQTSTHWLTYTHSETHTPALSASFLWRILAVVYVIELVITLQLEHHQAQRERVLPLSQEKKERQWKCKGKTRTEGRLDKNALKCFCTALISITVPLYLFYGNIRKQHTLWSLQNSFNHNYCCFDKKTPYKLKPFPDMG